MRIGFIGVGQIGWPMVEQLVAAGHDVSALARRTEVRDALMAIGAHPVVDARDAVRDAEIAMVCVFDDAQLRATVLDDGALAAMRPGSILVSHVTSSPTTAKELQDRAPAGVLVLDAPISGTADDVRAGRLTLLVGGDSAALDAATPVLAAYGDPILHVGGPGDGQLLKLVNNALFSATFRAACDAVLVAESIGIDRQRFIEAINHCSGDSFALRVLTAGPAGVMAKAVSRYLRKDVAAAHAAALEFDIDLGRLGRWADWFDG